MTTTNELIELVESMMDDAAALGRLSIYELRDVMNFLCAAVQDRTKAVDYRLKGETTVRLAFESSSDRMLAHARDNVRAYAGFESDEDAALPDLADGVEPPEDVQEWLDS